MLASDEERDPILEAIAGYDLVCSESMMPEVGNAVSAMFKWGRITREQGIALIEGLRHLDLQQIAINLTRAIEISYGHDLYAYDAYVLECAERLHQRTLADLKTHTFFRAIVCFPICC